MLIKIVQQENACLLPCDSHLVTSLVNALLLELGAEEVSQSLGGQEAEHEAVYDAHFVIHEEKHGESDEHTQLHLLGPHGSLSAIATFEEGQLVYH